MSNFDHFIGTRAVSEQHAFDTAALSAWLQQHLEGFVGPLSVEMFKGGQSNPTYKLVTPGKSYVMRAKPGPVAKLLPSAHAIEREFAVMSGLQGTDVPVPRMHVLCEDESIIGRAFYIMEFMQGRVLWDQALPGMNPEERTAIFNESNRVIARSAAGASSTWPRSRNPSRKWTSSWPGCPPTCPRAHGTRTACPSCMVTSAWTT